jgi:hypothetical protein
VGVAAEGHQTLETAAGTADPGEAAGQDAAVEVGAQVALDVGGEAAAGWAAVAGGSEEGLEPLADEGVEEGLLGLAPSVPGKGRTGLAVAAFPGLDRCGGAVRAGSQGKDRAPSSDVADHSLGRPGQASADWIACE